jgi:hypothetical protein
MWEESNAFWQARNAWTASRKEAQAKSGKVHANLDLSRKADQWAARGAHYLRGRPDIGEWMRRQDAGVEKFAERLATLMPAALAKAYDQQIAPVAFNAWRKWPVASGLSKSLIDVQYGQRGDDFSGRIVSGAPYTFFISGQPYRELIGQFKAHLVIAIGQQWAFEMAKASRG